MPNSSDSRQPIENDSKTQQRLNGLLNDIDLMTVYVTASGKTLSQEMTKGISELNCFRDDIDHFKKDSETCLKWFSLILKTHGHLSKLIEPATPTSLRATERIGNGFRIKNPAINTLIYITLLSLAGFIVTYINFSDSNNVKQNFLMFNLRLGWAQGFIHSRNQEDTFYKGRLIHDITKPIIYDLYLDWPLELSLDILEPKC